MPKEKLNLSEMAQGAFMEQFHDELQEVLVNIADPNTDLDYIETGCPIVRRGSGEDLADTLEMIRLREDEKLTYREIGEMFGMEGTSIHARIKRHKAKR